jgi:DNA-binding transcriptional ArsR family regulator
MTPDPLSSVFSALADPTRRAILVRLAEGPASVGELAKPFALSLPTVSRHLKVLARANLISRQVDAQWRRCSLQVQPLREADSWLARYRAFWEGQFASLQNYVAQLPAARVPTRKGSRDA